MYESIINLTPHAINIVKETDQPGVYDKIATIPPSGSLARLSQKTIRIAKLGEIPLSTTEFGEIEGLPDDDGIHYYIVSYHIVRRLNELGIYRDDVLLTNESVRDSSGNIIGCLSLAIM